MMMLRAAEPACRTPQGVRGLKHPAGQYCGLAESRTPQGVRGLKQGICGGKPNVQGRTPQGVRGLKHDDDA